MKTRIYVKCNDDLEILTEEEFEKRVIKMVNEDVADVNSDFYGDLLNYYSLKEVFEATEAEKDVMITEYRNALIDNLLLEEYIYRDLEI